MKKVLILISFTMVNLLSACSNSSSQLPVLPAQESIQNVSALSNNSQKDDFSKTDLNSDGFIDYKELVTEMMKSQPYFYGDVRIVAKQLFAKTDKNKDQKISRKEYYPATLTNGKAMDSSLLNNVKAAQSDLDKYFAESDTNKDGNISYKELESQMMESQPYFYGDVKVVAKQLFNKFDTNKDAKISKAEYKKGQQN